MAISSGDRSTRGPLGQSMQMPNSSMVRMVGGFGIQSAVLGIRWLNHIA
jgi:hypothetical protein